MASLHLNIVPNGLILTLFIRILLVFLEPGASYQELPYQETPPGPSEPLAGSPGHALVVLGVVLT